MKPERWQQLDQLFHAALERDPTGRAHFLKEACGDDELLRRQVEALLVAHEEAASFIEKPALEMEAQSLANEQSGSSAAMIGQSISHYRIISQLGEGGMGVVYLAQDTRLGRKVALKLLPEHFTRDEERMRRFEQEARAASALNHPNIITIHEIGQDGSYHFIAEEFIDGVTLSECIAGKRLELYEALDIALQVTSALAAAHAKGIVHRDIKPENIMVEHGSHILGRQNHVKVLDFGIAKLTEPEAATKGEATTRLLVKTGEGSAIGTAAYMSPEQARGESVDSRTDIWSLGVVLYEVLTGKQPFVGDTSQDVLASILRDDLPPLSTEFPESLKWILKKALRKDREERYQTAREMFSDLRDLHRPANEVRAREPFSVGSSQSVISGSTQTAAASTGEDRAAGAISSIEYNVSRIEQHKRGTVLVLATLVVAVAAVLAYVFYSSTRSQAISSIAVLPFANASGDPNMEYLSDGISENLINALSQLPQLKVIARSSAFKYKGKEVDPEEVAKALGVRAIVTGRVVQRGDSLQVSAEMVDAHDKTQLWGAQYSRKASDIQSVQEEIARTISEKLRLRLTAPEEQHLFKRATANNDAYQLYLNGMFYRRKGGFENSRKALHYFNQAAVLEPNFALAWAGVADAYRYLAANGLLEPQEGNAKAKAAAQKALELDEMLAEAHSALALIKMDEWDWSGAEREFKRAIELNPNLADSHSRYGYYLRNMGQLTEALVEIKRAQELDPLRLRLRTDEGNIFVLARRYEEAIRQFQNVIKLEPDDSFAHGFLGDTYAIMGMYPQSIAESQKAISIEGETPTNQCYLGYVLAQSGKRSEAEGILEKLKNTKEYVSGAELAVLYVGLGDKERAIASLERAYAAHDLQLQYLKADPYYDSLRHDPRFIELIRKVGLPP